MFDFVIVGAGLTGATMARILADNGNKVIVLEKRSHVGGNVFDHYHESGIRIHTYGPHYFRTSDERIWNYVNRFADFYDYIPCLKSLVDGKYENWPIAGSYIKREIGETWSPSFLGEAKNFEESALSLMPEKIYKKFVRGYNIKQWGVDPKNLSSELIKRFDVRMNDDPRLMPSHKYQGIPLHGYAAFMHKMLMGIPVVLNFDFLQNRDHFKPLKKLIFTGPIDAYYKYSSGKLKYRGQQRIHTYIPDIDYYQPCGQVNNPDLSQGQHIRTLEWKHMLPKEVANKIKGTVLTKEITVTPNNMDEFEYPFPDKENKELYLKYKSQAEAETDLLICGRLGEYKYYDMDQSIGRAMLLAKKIELNNS